MFDILKSCDIIIFLHQEMVHTRTWFSLKIICAVAQLEDIAAWTNVLVELRVVHWSGYVQRCFKQLMSRSLFLKC